MAALVAGGVGGRFGLGVDRLDELQIALQTVVDGVPDDGEVTVEFRLSGEALECRVRPTAARAEEVMPLLGKLVDGSSLVEEGDERWWSLVVRRQHAGATAP